MSVGQLIPHPFNDPARSVPEEGDPHWDELIRSVAANGVRMPVVAVSRAAFATVRPAEAAALPESGTHVLIYGHRRRAAAVAAGVESIPVIVEDEVMAEDGDLDLMALENLGRKDLGEFAQAEVFARYSEQLGLSQRAIADRLGVDQATVSRRLSLLLLTDEVRQMVEEGDGLSPAAAAAIGGAIPYGPVRGWQKGGDGQDTAQRKADQLAVVALVVHENWTPSRAAERVLTERRARGTAAAAGIEIVDPRECFGGGYAEHRIDDPGGEAGEIKAAIDDRTGELVYYRVELAGADAACISESSAECGDAGCITGEDDAAIESESEESARPTPVVIVDPDVQKPVESNAASRSDAAVAKAEAAAARRLQACAEAAARTPGKAKLGEALIAAVVLGVNLASPAVQVFAAELADGSESNSEASSQAWRLLLAGYEKAAQKARQGAWGAVQRTYLDLLGDHVGYVPGAWEEQAWAAQ